MRAALRTLWAHLQRPASFLLLPFSVVPLIAAVPLVEGAHSTYIRYYGSPPYPALGNVLSPTEQRAFARLPLYTGAIPVLAYHGVGRHAGPGGISRRAFAAQMEMLHLAGFHTISIGQYDRFERGDDAGLPERPILITFDDGRLSSYRGADRILAREGMRATMFVITSEILARNPVYLDWAELHRMAKSGRWDVQPETFRGNAMITVDPRGDERPFYAMRRYLRSTGEETFAAYQRRVAADLFDLAEQFRAQGFAVRAIAIPHGDYGQLDAGNDPRVPPFVFGLLRSQFGTVFATATQGTPRWNTPAPGAPQDRFVVSGPTTTPELYDWLRAGDPAPAAASSSSTTTQTTRTRS
jgi:hypothetical protein